MLIYLVEDDNSIRELVAYTLHSAGFEAEGFERPSAFWRACAERRPDLVLLDLMLPGLTGIEICRRVRKFSQVPIIMLTAKDEVMDKVAGLDSGADDYLTKPFHLAELSARIRSVVRRHQRDGQQSLDVGNVRLYPDSRRVEVAGCEVELLRKEYDILYYFMSRPNHMVDKATLAEAVWGDHIDQADNFDFVYAQMKNLRRRLHDAQADIEIRAVYGFGYKLVAP